MIKEKIDFKDIVLRGLVTVELFDARTGKLQERVQKENFIALGNQKWWAKLQRDSIINKMPRVLKNEVQSMENFYDDGYFFNRIVLTDDNSPEEPEKEKIMKGNLIGAVDIRGVATSTHSTAGVLNLNESFIDREKIHIVGDFGTDRGNGTFQSIGFFNNRYEYNEYQNSLYTYLGFTEYFINKGSSTANNLVTRIENKLYYIDYNTSSGTNTFYEFDLNNPELGLQEVLVATGSRPRTGLTNDGEHLWLARNNHQLIKINWDGSINTLDTEIPTIRGIYFDKEEDVFYVTSGSTANNPIDEPWNTCMYKVDKNTGEILEIFPYIFRDFDFKVCDRLKDGTFVFFDTQGKSITFQDFEKQILGPVCIMRGLDYSGTQIANDGEDNFYFISYSSMSDCRIGKIHTSNMCSRVLLPSPQIKTNTQTMKLTYDLYYTDWTKL